MESLLRVLVKIAGLLISMPWDSKNELMVDKTLVITKILLPKMRVDGNNRIKISKAKIAKNENKIVKYKIHDFLLNSKNKFLEQFFCLKAKIWIW